MSMDASRNVDTEIVVVIGAGAIGQAIARRVGVAKTVFLADNNEDAAEKAATSLSGAGYSTRTAHADVSSSSSVNALADMVWCTSFTRRDCRPPRRRRGRSSRSIWSARPTSWRRLAASSPPAARGSSSPVRGAT